MISLNLSPIQSKNQMPSISINTSNPQICINLMGVKGMHGKSVPSSAAALQKGTLFQFVLPKTRCRKFCYFKGSHPVPI